MSGKGYLFAVCREDDGTYIGGAVHVERDCSTQSWLYETDQDAARGAERDGVRLLYGIPYVEDGIYLDTTANRRVLALYSTSMQRMVERRTISRKEAER